MEVTSDGDQAQKLFDELVGKKDPGEKSDSWIVAHCGVPRAVLYEYTENAYRRQAEERLLALRETKNDFLIAKKLAEEFYHAQRRSGCSVADFGTNIPEITALVRKNRLGDYEK
jgi:hypothetical protein